MVENGPESSVTAPSRNVERIDRIVDASAELLSQRGYRRVTVEEVAGRAGVSKSSVYLHWNTKDEIFYDVLDREFTGLACAIVDLIRRDPVEVLAHRMAVNLLRIIAGRPLIKALLIDDRVILGPLLPAKSEPFRMRLAVEGELMWRYLGVLQRNLLLRLDADLCVMRKATCEMLRGMFLSMDSKTLEGSCCEELSRVMMMTVQRAFEPEAPPPVARITAAAVEVLEAFEELMQPETVVCFERSVSL